MNWKLIFTLSLFGLAMAFATISIISQNLEVFIWLPIFIVCAVMIARNAPGRYFLHGFLVSIVNCIWITAAHIIWSDTYILHHAGEAEGYKKLNESLHVTVSQGMLIMGPFFGIFSGLVLGLFAFIASKLVKKGHG